MPNSDSYSCIYRCPTPYSMKVTGEGTVYADPDTAILSLGVVTENISLMTAQNENSQKTKTVINGLIKLGIPEKHISTSNYSIQPVYDFADGKQLLRGYRVLNYLSVTVTELDKIGEIIDTSTSSGANAVNNIDFKIGNPSLYYYKALKLSVMDAKKKADELSNAMGVNVYMIPYRIIEETTKGPSRDIIMLKAASDSTPVLPGRIAVTARIEAYFCYR